MIDRASFSNFTAKDILGYILLFLNGVGCITITNYAVFYKEYNWILIGLAVMLFVNLLFCCLDFKKRIIVFIFHLTIFLFLLSRIIIPGIQGIEWWNNYGVEANVFAAKAINYSMISITVGFSIIEMISKIQKRSTELKGKDIKKFCSGETLLFVVRVVLVICMVCFFIREIDKLMFMRGRAYEEYFSAYQTRMPFFVTFPAGCMQFVLCMLLALKPSKKESFIWLFIYIISSLPMLKIGVRNPIILNCLFAFVYYFLRDGIRKKEEKKWIGKFEKLLIVCVVPVMILFLGAYNYIRSDKEVNLSPANLIVDFAYKQGTTYDTVLQGYVHKEELPWKEEQVYTVGALTDAFFYNSLGRKIFVLEDIGNGNGLKMVNNGHTFSHAISYVVLGENYIAGEGRGSSYIIENYVDWGYPGVICFSIILGMICFIIPYSFGKRWISSVVILNIVINFFFTPRAESLAFITFIVSYKFWGCIIGVLVLTKILEMCKAKYKFNGVKRFNLSKHR